MYISILPEPLAFNCSVHTLYLVKLKLYVSFQLIHSFWGFKDIQLGCFFIFILIVQEEEVL